jgi:DNA polymerase-4
MPRTIVHVDMDEFFAAVEKLDNPVLRGKPLLIGGSPDSRGVVSTASYEARRFGCRSAMPMATAVKRCPQAIVLPVRGARYREVSEQVFALFDRFTPLVEPASIDEAFLDVTGTEKLFGPGSALGAELKRTIRRETGLTASVGVAPNKFLAKLASDLRKPDGLVVIAPERLQEVLDPLPVARLWGIGPAAVKRFERLRIRTIGELRAAPASTLRQVFGNAAEHYLALARGEDGRPVHAEREPKSLGQEQTFAADIDGLDELKGVLLAHVEEVARRLRAHGLAARTVTIKLRYGDFTTVTRSATRSDPTNATAELWQAALALFTAWSERQHRPLRLLGMTASNLCPEASGQLPLFEGAAHVKQRELDRAIDEIADRFGTGAVRRAGTRPPPER